MQAKSTPTATVTIETPGRSKIPIQGPWAQEKSSEAVEIQASRILDALDRGDVRGARTALELAEISHRLPQVLSADRAGRRADAELAKAWRTRGLSPLDADEVSANSLARALVSAFASGGDVVATGALLACLAGRATSALLANEAFAVRVGARDPAMVKTLLASLSADQRVMALATGRGEILAALLARRDADELLAALLDEVVKHGDPALAAKLLRETRGLLFTAARERRLAGALAPLLALAGPEFRAAIDEHRATLQRFKRDVDSDVSA